MTQKHYQAYDKQQAQAPEITSEMVDYYVQYGNHLRAAAMATFFAGLTRRIAQVWGGGTTAKPAEQTVAERFANGLAAIRSSAEILRDTPDLAEAERARFVAIVLEEERRLARALDALPSHAQHAVAGR